MCKKDGVSPKKNFSGKFNVRVSPSLHEDLVAFAAAESKSISQVIVDSLSESIE